MKRFTDQLFSVVSLIAVLTLFQTAVADEIPALRPLLSSWSAPTAVAGNGRYAYVYTGNAVNNTAVLDIGNPRLPIDVGECALPAGIKRLEMADSTTLYALTNDRIYAYDITDPLEPTHIGQYQTFTPDVTIKGRLLFIPAPGQSIEIVRFQLPAGFTLIGSYPCSPSLLTAYGNKLAFGSGDSIISLLNIDDPEQPTLLSEWHRPAITDLQWLQYDSTWTTELRDIAMGDCTLCLYYRLEPPGGMNFGANYWYVLDITSPEQPDTVTTNYEEDVVDCSVSYLRWIIHNNIKLDVSTGFSFFPSKSSGVGVEANDISSSHLFRWKGKGSLDETMGIGFTAYDSLMYLFSVNNFRYPDARLTIYDFSDALFKVGEYGGGGRIEAVYSDGEYICVVGYREIRFFKVTEPLQPVLVQNIPVHCWGFDEIWYYTGDMYRGRMYYRGWGTGSVSAETGEWVEGVVRQANSICFNGDYAYYWGSDTLSVVDISDPLLPVLKQTQPIPHSTKQSATTSQNTMYAFLTGVGLTVWDISVPAEPKLITTVENQQYQFSDLQVVGNRLIAGKLGAQLQQYDITDPLNPHWVAFGNNPGNGAPTDRVGMKLLIADGANGFSVIDFAEADHPEPLGYHRSGKNTNRVVSANSTIFTSDFTSLGLFDGTNYLTAPAEPSLPVPSSFALSSIHPNPFNSSTRIAYDLPAGGSMSLTVYDLSGREVAKLVDGVQPAGRHSVVWEAGDVPAGVYLVKLTGGSEVTAVKKVVLVK